MLPDGRQVVHELVVVVVESGATDDPHVNQKEAVAAEVKDSGHLSHLRRPRPDGVEGHTQWQDLGAGFSDFSVCARCPPHGRYDLGDQIWAHPGRADW